MGALPTVENVSVVSKGIISCFNLFCVNFAFHQVSTAAIIALNDGSVNAPGCDKSYFEITPPLIFKLSMKRSTLNEQLTHSLLQ